MSSRPSIDIRVALCATCAFLLLLASASAQQPTFRSQTNLVLVPVLVKDHSGNAIYGLHAKDFAVEDDGVLQQVHLDEAAESEPISLVVAVQRGRSAPYEYERMRGLDTMLDPILSDHDAQVAIVAFDDQIELVRDFTNDREIIASDLKGVLSRRLGRWYPQPGEGGAAILDAVDYSLKLLDKLPEKRQRVLLLLSETRDHGSHFARIDDIVADVGKTNASIFALTFSPSKTNVLDTLRGNNNDRWVPRPDLLYPIQEIAQSMRKNVAKEIASLTGGEYAGFSSRKSFDARLNDFTNHLHSRYLLSFESKAPYPGFHHLRVRVTGAPHATVLSRSGYWAMAPAQ